MPVDFSKKDQTDEHKANKQLFDWRPPVGTKVLIVKHKFAANRTGVVDAHETWMSLKTISVTLDSTNQRVGVTDLAQIKVLDD